MSEFDGGINVGTFEPVIVGSTGEPRSETDAAGAAVVLAPKRPLRGAAVLVVVLEVPSNPCRGLVVTDALPAEAEPAAVDRGNTLGTFDRVRADARDGEVRTTGSRFAPKAPRAAGCAGCSWSEAWLFCCWVCFTSWPMLVAWPAATAMNAAPIMAREMDRPRLLFRCVCCEEFVIEMCLLRRARQRHCRIAVIARLLIPGFPAATSPHDQSTRCREHIRTTRTSTISDQQRVDFDTQWVDFDT